MPLPQSEFLAACRALIGPDHVVTDANELAPALLDRRGNYAGQALALLKPADTAQVAELVRLCRQHQVPLVPQGGNTGLVMGSVPDTSGRAVILSTRRLNRIRQLDAVNNTMTVEAGCILQTVQEAASFAQRMFPLSLASEGSCTIGGNLSTNAGGTAVLRYGNMRELCLGLEVVTATGEIWNGLRGLRKDNTGYDLRDLFIGAEGTLGIITAAVLKLFPKPVAHVTAVAAMQSPRDALALLTLAQRHCGASLTGFELMSGHCLELVGKHFPHLPLSFDQSYPQYVLLELESSESNRHANALLEKTLAEALEDGIAEDAIISQSLTQSAALWQLREHIPAAQAAEGGNIKHDISLPVSAVARFIEVTDNLLQAHFPACRMVCFGHLGDGNLHYNVAAPAGTAPDAFFANQEAVNRIVYDSVHQFDGSISAEHGIGALKRADLRRYKSAIEIELMQALKNALDPGQLMNPGKII